MTGKISDKISRRQTLAAMIAAGMVPTLARGAHAAGPDFAAFNAGYAKQIVLPAFQRLFEAATALAKVAPVACASGSVASDDLKKAFNDISDAWARAQQFKLGPLAEAQRSERISYWPERRNIVEKQLSALLKGHDTAELEADRFAGASVAIQGLPALERLLYGEHGPAERDDARRCAIIRAIADNLRTIVTETLDGWTAKLGGPSLFATNPAEGTTQAYTNLLTIMQIVGDQKIGVPLGGDAAGAKPKAAEQWRSGRSLHNIQLNLATARASVIEPGGFGDLLGSDQATLRQDIANAFDDAIAAAQAAGEDLPAAVGHPEKRKLVTSLLVKINHLRDLLRQQVPPAIGITLGFNELDGDGS